MNNINCLLVDDEYLALNLLENYVNQAPGLKVLAKTKSPMEAIDIIEKEQVDLLFLDIQMPRLSGVNLLKALKSKPITIFTTAYSDFAVDAYGLDVVDYLVKPFSFERFLQSVGKAKELLKNRSGLRIKEVSSNNVQSNHLSIKVDAHLVKLALSSVCFVEGLKEYVKFVCDDGKTYVTLASLKSLTDKLPKNFMRIHKSYIVNIDKVRSIEGNQLHLDHHRLPVSRDTKQEVLNRIFG